MSGRGSNKDGLCKPWTSETAPRRKPGVGKPTGPKPYWMSLMPPDLIRPACKSAEVHDAERLLLTLPYRSLKPLANHETTPVFLAAQAFAILSEMQNGECKTVTHLLDKYHPFLPPPEVGEVVGAVMGVPRCGDHIDRIHAFLSYMRFSGNLCFVYGTTRSGKTYAILQWLVEALLAGVLSGQILVAGQTMPFLRNGAAAYLKAICRNCTKDSGIECLDNGLRVRTPNGEITCQSFENPDRVLSAQWSAVFLNEGNVIPTEIVDGLAIRNSGLTIVDFNPSVTAWWGGDKMTDANQLFCTFRDNRFLGEQQLGAIEDIRTRGENAEVGSYEWWYYQVYYLGNFAEVGGGVFKHLHSCDAAEFDAAEGLCIAGIDFGDVADPNALCLVKYQADSRRLYVRCVFYQTDCDDAMVVDALKANKVDYLVFETATGGHTRAKNFRHLGYEGRLQPCEKERVAAGVFQLAPLDIWCADDISLSEFRGYTIRDGRFNGPDHCIDAVRYAAHLLITNRLKQ